MNQMKMTEERLKRNTQAVNEVKMMIKYGKILMILGIILTTLKACGFIYASWIFILAPFWILPALSGVAWGLYFAIVGIIFFMDFLHGYK